MPTVVITDNTTGGDFTGTEDAMMREFGINSGTNYGSAVNAEVHALSAGTDINDLLIRFPGLANITGPVTVTAATLELYMDSNFFGVDGNLDLFRVLRNWVEAQASGDNWSTGNAWSTPGARGSGTDRAASATQAGRFVSTASGQWISFSNANLIADVQGFINGTLGNHGWVIYADPADAPTAQFVTSEGTDGFRPRLTVTYTASGPAGSAAAAAHYYRRRRAA